MDFAVQRTWVVFAGDRFLGYEYATAKEEALGKSIRKFGNPDIWDVEEFTLEKIKWAEEDI